MNMKDEEPKIINNFIKLIPTNNAPLVDATFLSLNLSKNSKISSRSQDAFILPDLIIMTKPVV